MTLTLPPNTLRVSVTRPGGTGPAFDIPGRDIIEFQTAQQAGKQKGEGSLVIDNDHWQYTTGEDQIGIGDRIDIAGFPNDGRGEAITGFGEDPFGDGPFGGTDSSEAETVFKSDLGAEAFGAGAFGDGAFGAGAGVTGGWIATLLVEDWQIIEHGPQQSDLVLETADWVYGRLEKEVPFVGLENRPISGASNAIVNEILTEYAPEIDQSALSSIPEIADYYTNGTKTVREALDDVAKIAAQLHGPVVQSSYAGALIFEPIENLSFATDEPMGATTSGSGSARAGRPRDRDFGQWSTASESQNMVNSVRVTGGIDDEGNVDDEQTTVSDYVTVTSNDYVTAQVQTRKSELSTIFVYTYGGNVSEDGIRVRLQASNSAGDGPIRPDSESSDIVTGSRRKVALDPDGWTKFNMGQHDIPERNPWLIIDSDGETGHQIGVDSNGVPAYRVLFPKPITAEVTDPASQSEYGVFSKHITNKSLVTQAAVRNKANAVIEDGKTPTTTIGPLSCESLQAHGLEVGQLVKLDRPELRATGAHLVVKKESDYSAEDGRLSTTVELAGAGSYV